MKNKVTSRFIKIGLLLCFVFFLSASAQINKNYPDLKQAQAEFDNGNYEKAIEYAEKGIENAKKNKSNLLFSKGTDIIVSSQISLKRYDKAAENLNKAFLEQSENAPDNFQKALIYLRFAWLYRTQRKFAEAFDNSKKAIETMPQNRQILAEHYLVLGRILFASGNDISAIIWLEKAEKLLESEKGSSAKIDAYRILSLAWSSKSNYSKALQYAEKCVSSAENTRFKYKHRQALFELATMLGGIGQKQKAFASLKYGLKLSLSQNNSYQSRNFLHSLLLHSLYDGDEKEASDYLQQLEKMDADHQFSFEIGLAKAVISAFRGQDEFSEKLFAELDELANSSDFILLYWKITIAERKQNWRRLINFNRELLDKTIENGFRQDLPGIYLNFAKAYFKLEDNEKSLENVEKSLGYIEEIRKSENQNLSLGILETYHDAYRLLAQIKSGNSQESFELADFLKARLLKDRINNAASKSETNFSPAIRRKLEKLSLQFINDQSGADEIEANEKFILNAVPELNLAQSDLTKLDEIPELSDTAIISYFFTLDKKLLAFVYEKDKPIQTLELPITEEDVELAAVKTRQDIMNRVFFKRDGKNLFDKLLKPLALTSKHLIIVPDKSLWKIPFQALSSDGEKYLIEEKLISYAPSVSILLEQLKNPQPIRQTLQTYANSSFENKVLQYVDTEAATVAEIYNSKPIINATVDDFIQTSEKQDILHFSMHAEVDNEQPLDSFLGFRKFGKDDGRLTVEELMDIKLKKGSLVFLASCDTNNVLNGEGLVSLAWAMMGSGATTVVSAGWEANDKSTSIFTKTFYEQYKQGVSSAEAMRKASMELIKNKSNNMHEPYYWAAFTLNGDYR